MPSTLQLSVLQFLSKVHKCRTEKDSVLALQLHDVYMCQSSVINSAGNHLVPVLVEFGYVNHAQRVFDVIASPDEYSWSSLITGYVKCGEPKFALDLYDRLRSSMQCPPTGFAFSSLLKACSTLNDIEKGCELHSHVTKTSLLRKDVYVGSSLVDMYAKCGSMDKAQEIFDMLPVQDVVSWTALIAGYAECGKCSRALDCFDQMQNRCIPPDCLTFSCSLRACSGLGILSRGQEIHIGIAKKGLETEIFIGNALIDMYVKCGLLSSGLGVFKQLPVRDVISWNALIAGYTDNDHEEEALHCFEQMQYEGISQDAITFISVLKTCGALGAHLEGQKMHSEITRKGLESELLISSSLVSMYGKCGLLCEAKSVVDKVPDINIVFWNALIAGYLEHGYGEEALNCVEEMQQYKIPFSSITFVFALKACSSMGPSRDIHVDVTKRGWETDLLIGNALVDMYTRCGALTEAQQLFDMQPVQDLVLWTTLMSGYVEHGNNDKVLECYQSMKNDGLCLSAITYVCVLKACGNLGSINEGLQLHAEMIKIGFEMEALVGNTLVDMYAKCGWLGAAHDVFEKLPVQELISWNALISAYIDHGYYEKALDCFNMVQLLAVCLNGITLICSLKASGSIGATIMTIQIHTEILRKGLEEEVIISNTLIDTYAKCGLLAEAQSVFDNLHTRDVVSWTALMGGYAQLGDSETVFLLFEEMLKEETKPNSLTLISVLNACNHAGLVEKGEMYFEVIVNNFGLNPSGDHFTCLVDLLGRAGHVEITLEIIRKMPLHPDVMMWQKVLGACRKWSNVELGRHAFKNTVVLDETYKAAYVCMSNIYADSSMDQGATIF